MSSLTTAFVGSSVTPGIRVADLAGKVGYVVAKQLTNRAVTNLADRAVTSLNGFVDNYMVSPTGGNSSSAGDTSNSNSTGNSSSSNNSNNKPPHDSGKAKNPKGGRRPRNRGNIGGGLETQGVPRVTLDTGIKSGTLINPLQNPTGDYTPLFIQCGQFFPELESNKDSTFANLMNSDLYYKYLILVQSEVNYSLAKNFTQDKLYNYIITVSLALQLYYTIDSILAFTSNTPNNNIGMTRLRMAITPDIVNGHIRLKDFLETTPIPPNLVSYIRYMYQNFSFSEVVGSPIIKMSLVDVLCTSEYDKQIGIDDDTYSTVIYSLIDQSETISIIKKIRPSWVSSLLPSFVEALYDAQFVTFWHNCNVAYEEYDMKTIKYSRNAKTVNDPLYYGIFGDNLDGLIYSSSSIFLDSKTMELGLWKPFDKFQEKKSINSSVLFYSKDGLVRPVTDRSIRIASMVYSAPYSYVTKDGNLVWELVNSSYAGAQIPQVHTLENVTQAISRSMIWLLNP